MGQNLLFRALKIEFGSKFHSLNNPFSGLLRRMTEQNRPEKIDLKIDITYPKIDPSGRGFARLSGLFSKSIFSSVKSVCLFV